MRLLKLCKELFIGLGNGIQAFKTYKKGKVK